MKGRGGAFLSYWASTLARANYWYVGRRYIFYWTGTQSTTTRKFLNSAKNSLFRTVGTLEIVTLAPFFSLTRFRHRNYIETSYCKTDSNSLYFPLGMCSRLNQVYSLTIIFKRLTDGSKYRVTPVGMCIQTTTDREITNKQKTIRSQKIFKSYIGRWPIHCAPLIVMKT